MKYRIEFETKAKREFLKLSRDIQDQLADVLEDLSKEPRPPGAKKLLGKAGYRIRKGDYRILYLIQDKKRLVQVYRIGHRREVYRR